MQFTTGRRWAMVAAVVAAAALTLSGCSGSSSPNQSGDSGAAPGNTTDYTVAVVTHGTPGDPFWAVVKAGAEAAGKQYGITVTYQSDPDPAKQSQLIENAIAAKVNGVVVSMANPDGVKQAIADAEAAKIPVITINSGEEQSQAFGALNHVGQDESIAGQGAGSHMKALGVKNMICIIHEAGNVGLEQRCAGAAQTLGGTVKNVQVSVANVADAQNTIKSALLADPSIDGVLTLNPAIAVAASNAIDQAGLGGKVQLATFDTSTDVLKLIEQGQIAFAIDQQPYLQGYLPVVLFNLYWTNGNVVGGGQPILSGPGYITKDNAADVETYSAAGTR